MTSTSAATIDAGDIRPPDGSARLLEALRLVQAPRTVSEVFGAAAKGLRMLGFQRTLLSRVVDGRWESVGTEGLRPLLALPPEWTGGIEMHLADAARSLTSPLPYAVAPIAPAGNLLAMAFADQPLGLRRVNDDDRNLLTLFAESTGCVLQRAELAERVEVLRSTLDGDGTSRLILPAGRSEGSPPQTSLSRPSGAGRVATTDGCLTQRERDIMELVARGATNTQVARRLVLSEGTVKWHMKNIFRKLRVPNRAAAVSTWFAESSAL